MVILKQLGHPSVSRAGTVVTGRAGHGYRLALLAILAAAHGRPVPRDKVIALLWPESPTDRGRHQLSDTLYILRSALGKNVIHARGDDLLLDTDAVESDVVEFDRRIDAGELEQAVELFCGTLLDGFHLSDSPEFEHWLDVERMRVEQRYAHALEELARRSEAAGDVAAALGWWRALATHDPHSGRVALGLMRALEATGDRAGALRHARHHADLLEQEFDAEPDSDVAAFAERLRSAPVPRAAPPSIPLPDVAAEPIVGGDPVDVTRAAARPRRRPRHATLAIAERVVTAVVGAVYGAGRRRPPRANVPQSVAVLPFVSMSGESGTDYFSDGLSEQVISVLSRIPGLSVAARTSSFALRDAKLDIRTIGDTLNVSAVLEGSVRRDGNRLRITAQLIDARTGHHLWSADYDREMHEVVKVQDEIARDIAHALELRLPIVPSHPASQRTPNLQAYDLYLRALHLRDTYTPDALQQARAYLDRALELDPDFARAHALKATVLAPAIFYRHIPLEPGLAEVRNASARALELDPGMGEAYAAVGAIRIFFDYDFAAAERALLRAVELNQNDIFAWHLLGNLYSVTGRPADEVAARARGVALDPLNRRIGFTLALAYVDAGLLQEALTQFERMLKLNARDALALGLGHRLPAGPGLVHLKQGRHHEAVEDYVRVANLRGATSDECDSLRASFQRGGMPAFWRSWLDFELRHSAGDPDPVRVARLHALAGDEAQAVEWLERAQAEGSPALVFVFNDSDFDAVREQPRFRRIFRQLNFPVG